MNPPPTDHAEPTVCTGKKNRPAPLKLRYSLDLFCWDVPRESRLIKTLIPNSKDATYYLTPNRERHVEQESIVMEGFLRTLESFRDDVLQCSEAYVSFGFFPDVMLAECTLRIPASHIRRLADCGVGLEVAAYPNGSDQTRYRGALFFVVAAEGQGAQEDVLLPPSIRRALRARGLHATAVHDHDLSFADATAFLATTPNLQPRSHCMPPQTEPGLLSLNKYLGEFHWPTFFLTKDIIERIAEMGDDLELHFNFPQRRARKVRMRVC